MDLHQAGPCQGRGKVVNARVPCSALALLIVSHSSVPLFAWKTKKGILQSVHEIQARRAAEFLMMRYAANTREWARFRVSVEEACGTLTNDGNAHGNALPMAERRDPEDSARIPFSTDALTFNGGPVYRWFTRALEAHGQVDHSLPDRFLVDASWPVSKESWRRTRGRGPAAERSPRTPAQVYRYLGFMVHLAQDNSSPAHIANIRHGPWDGVEWWHWDAWGLGGGGASAPALAADLAIAYGPWFDVQRGEIAGKASFFWNYDNKTLAMDPQGRDLRGASKEGWDFKPLDGILTDLVRANRALVMNRARAGEPGGPYPFYFRGFGDPTAPQGRWILPDAAPSIWSFEANWVAGYYLNRLGSGPAFAQALFTSGGVASQVRFLPEAEHGILLANEVIPFDQFPERPSLRWQQLNDGRTPWIPHPNYSGNAFDARWGSYGGFFGFPGRMPIEGQFPGFNLTADFFTRGKQRITPGDLYTVHEHLDQYNEQDLLAAVDERSLAPSQSPMARARPSGWAAEFGQELQNRATLWSAALMDSFSRALPPVINRFTVEPRRVTGSPFDGATGLPAWYDQRVLPWLSGTSGARISLELDLNRSDDYTFELFAVPRRQFMEPRDWSRPISFWSLANPGATLWESDVKVLDEPGSEGTGELPVASNYPGRNADLVYSKLMGYPLVLARGFKPVRERNFLSMDPSEVLASPAPMVPLLTNDEASGRYAFRYEGAFDWTGEVGDPVRILKEDGSLGGGEPADGMPIPTAPLVIEGKKLLLSGDYLLLLVAYRNGWRYAFARNQYKSLSPAKEVLEFQQWWVPESKWTNDWVNNAIRASRLPGAQIRQMIPDELVPIRVDTTGPIVRLE